jgi:hypothetical protein
MQIIARPILIEQSFHCPSSYRRLAFTPPPPPPPQSENMNVGVALQHNELVHNINSRQVQCVPGVERLLQEANPIFIVFQNIDPPSLSPPGEFVLPPQQRRGVHSRPAEKGRGGQYFGTR